VRDWLHTRLAAALAVLGNIVGLRSTESDVTITVEGRWSGRFDPVRLGLTALMILAVMYAGLCTAFSWGANGAPWDLVREGSYQMPTP
jgi:hypothetical protein